MSIWIAAGIAVGTAFLALYLRMQQKEIAALAALSAAIVIFAASLSKVREAAEAFQGVLNSGIYGDMVVILLKALGISWIAQIAADVCRETGESVLGAQLEAFAKIEITLLALPLAARLLDFAGELL